jgi:hypothetical protein
MKSIINEEKMDPEIDVEFEIKSNQITPDEITNYLGILPTRKLLTGEFIGKSLIRMKNNIWCLSVKNQEDSLDLSDYLTPIIEQLMPKKEIISKLCLENDVTCVFECGIYIIEQSPIMDLSPKLLTNIVELKASLDLDIILTA